jgi:hypothetical protein
LGEGLQAKHTIGRYHGDPIYADTFPNNTLGKNIIPPKCQVMKPSWKTWIGKDMLDKETWRELRRNKFFYSFKEPWEPSHRCMGKGKVHYIEVVIYQEDDDDDEVIP